MECPRCWLLEKLKTILTASVILSVDYASYETEAVISCFTPTLRSVSIIMYSDIAPGGRAMTGVWRME